MKKDVFEIFGLGPDATLSDVKKAYRKLAKRFHPDRFTDEKEKKEQAAVMARINDAYQELLALFRKGHRPSPKKDTAAETDTSLYKKGVEIYGRLNIAIALKIGAKEIDIVTVNAKIEQAQRAEEYFTRLLKTYPDSDWAVDTEERLKDIPKYIELLKENRDFLNTHKIGSTKKGTPTWKKK